MKARIPTSFYIEGWTLARLKAYYKAWVKNKAIKLIEEILGEYVYKKGKKGFLKSNLRSVNHIAKKI
jgi:hypothetical protein